MTESDKFLSRWSRLKQEAKRAREVQGDAPGVERGPEIESEEPAAKAKTDSDLESPLDLSTLPPIELITSGTDIRSFLQKGVPFELTRAALRRAWVTDPAIRDFIEVAENQWDFATGQGLPGFGPLELSDDVRRIVAEVFQRRLADPVEPATTAGDPDIGADPQDLAPEQPKTGQSVMAELNQPGTEERARQDENNSAIVHGEEENIAMHHDTRQADSQLSVARRHGRALPQ